MLKLLSQQSVGGSSVATLSGELFACSRSFQQGDHGLNFFNSCYYLILFQSY